MTAAKVMDIISRLPGCGGQAAAAVSTYTHVKMEDAPNLLKIPKSECPDIWIRLPRHKWPKSWSSMEDPVVHLERNLCGHLLAGLLWEREFEKILPKYGWEKVSNWECLFVHREKGLFLSVYVDDIKLAGKKQNISPMWNVLNKEVDLGEPTSFLDHVYLGCTQRHCEISKDIVDNYRTLFESTISAGATEKLPCSENLRISSWSYDLEVHAKKCVERYCELANKTTQQLYKVSTPCIDDHRFRDEEFKSVGELPKVRSQIVLEPKLWYLFEDEINEGFLQKTHRYSRAQSGTFGWLDNSRSQSSQRKQSSIRCRGTRFGNTMDSIFSVQNRNFSGNTKAKLVKIFPGIIVRRHHTDRKHMGLPKEQCAEWKNGHLQYCCNHVWIKKKLADSMECYCYLRNIQDFLWQMGEHLMNGDLENYLKDLWFRVCKEMCGAILWVSKQDDASTLPSVYSMYRWPPLQRRRNEICWRIVTSMLPYCSEMLVLGTYWKTWNSMVSEQTFTIDLKMDQSLWQTIISFDPLHSSNMWIQTVLPCGKHCQTVQIGTVSRLRFCRRSSTSGGTLCIFGSHTFVPISWRCKKQTSVSHSSTESEIISFGCKIKVGRSPRTWFMGSDRRSSWKHESEF